MNSEDEIHRQLEEIKRSQQEFIAEWRAAREETLQKEQALREEQSRLKADTAARQKEYRFQLAIVFIFFAIIVWQVYRSTGQTHTQPSAARQSK